MYVLILDGIPIAAAERMQRLAEHMAGYDAVTQAQMSITPVEFLE
jgi:hypothetical protein